MALLVDTSIYVDLDIIMYILWISINYSLDQQVWPGAALAHWYSFYVKWYWSTVEIDKYNVAGVHGECCELLFRESMSVNAPSTAPPCVDFNKPIVPEKQNIGSTTTLTPKRNTTTTPHVAYNTIKVAANPKTTSTTVTLPEKSVTPPKVASTSKRNTMEVPCIVRKTSRVSEKSKFASSTETVHEVVVSSIVPKCHLLYHIVAYQQYQKPKKVNWNIYKIHYGDVCTLINVLNGIMNVFKNENADIYE